MCSSVALLLTERATREIRSAYLKFCIQMAETEFMPMAFFHWSSLQQRWWSSVLPPSKFRFQFCYGYGSHVTSAFIFPQTGNCDLEYADDIVPLNEEPSKLQAFLHRLNDSVCL